MNIQKFTQKSIEAINDCEKLAYEYSHQEIDIEHLMVALLSVDDSFIRKLIIKMGIDADAFLADCEGLLARRNKVTGNVELIISQGLNKILICSEDEAKLMGDQYVSVEHIFLTILKYPNKAVSDLFSKYLIDRE